MEAERWPLVAASKFARLEDFGGYPVKCYVTELRPHQYRMRYSTNPSPAL
jgi:hypothetical protein